MRILKGYETFVIVVDSMGVEVSEFETSNEAHDDMVDKNIEIKSSIEADIRAENVKSKEYTEEEVLELVEVEFSCNKFDTEYKHIEIEEE